MPSRRFQANFQTLDLAGLLKTKQSAREKDAIDRRVLERVIEALRYRKHKRPRPGIDILPVLVLPAPAPPPAP